MKKIFTLFSIVIFTISAYAQDLIVTNSGDSINCKITKVKKDYIFFTFLNEGKIANTIIAVSSVKDYKFKHSKIMTINKKDLPGYCQHFRLALNAGYSYDLVKISDNNPSEFREYFTDLKSGYHLGTDLTYYLNQRIGVGLKYSFFQTSNEINIYLQNEDGTRRYGTMRDDITISFIGPTFSTRHFNAKKENAWITGLSIGYMKYTNDGIFIDHYKQTGSTIGMILDLGYDIGLSENFSLGFQVGFVSGVLTQYDLNNGKTTQTIELNKGEYIGLYRIDFSVGLRLTR